MNRHDKERLVEDKRAKPHIPLQKNSDDHHRNDDCRHRRPCCGTHWWFRIKAASIHIPIKSSSF